MAKPIAQNSSANVVIGPIIDASGSAVIGAAIANSAIVLVKEASTSAARNAGTSAASVGPALYRIVLNSTDTDTLGTLAVLASVSGGLPFRYDVEIWQSTTHALFYGTANQIATSAAVSAITSTVAAQALSDYGALVSANLSGGIDAALVQRGLHMLVNASSSVAGIHDNSIVGITWASASSDAFDRTTDSLRALSQAALTSAGVSAQVGTVLTNYDVPTSADVSAIVATQGGISSAQASTIMAGVLSDYDVTSAGDVLTSAQVSSIVGPAVWNRGGTEPTVPIAWGSANRGQIMDWLGARSLNKHVQTASDIEILSSAGAVIASASVGNNSTSATRAQFVG